MYIVSDSRATVYIRTYCLVESSDCMLSDTYVYFAELWACICVYSGP